MYSATTTTMSPPSDQECECKRVGRPRIGSYGERAPRVRLVRCNTQLWSEGRAKGPRILV